MTLERMSDIRQTTVSCVVFNDYTNSQAQFHILRNILIHILAESLMQILIPLSWKQGETASLA